MTHSSYLQTIRGQVPADDLGLILPHEHLFTDLRGPSVPDYAQADPEDVVKAISPFLIEAHSHGVTGIVECSTVGVGRNIQILKKLSENTPIHIIVPTGVYQENYIPAFMKDYSIKEFAKLWVKELTKGIEDTNIQAGFIKISMSNDGPTALEIKVLKSAVIASQQTGAIISSHTPSGDGFYNQFKIIEKEGLDSSRFIWVHANLEEDKKIHLDAAQKGVFVEFDAVGASWQAQHKMADYTLSLIGAGYSENILLSHDAGWYQPGNPNGEPEDGYRGFADLSKTFIPSLITKGVPDETIKLITQDNPKRAYGFQDGGL